MIFVYINNKLVHRGKNMKIILKNVAQAFKQGHTNITISGGKIGKWR